MKMLRPLTITTMLLAAAAVGIIGQVASDRFASKVVAETGATAAQPKRDIRLLHAWDGCSMWSTILNVNYNGPPNREVPPPAAQFSKRILDRAQESPVGSQRFRMAEDFSNPKLRTTMQEIVELGHARGVPVYANISESGIEQWGSRVEAWRGAAANIWRSGADGIHLFNRFPATPGDPVFAAAGDPLTLARLNKVFGIDNIAENYGCLEPAVVQSQILPVQFGRSGMPREVNLPVGDDIAAAAQAGNLANAILRVKFLARAPEDQVELYLNGILVKPESDDPEKGLVTYRPDPGLYHPGDNRLAFRLTAGRPTRKTSVSVESVELDVEYR